MSALDYYLSPSTIYLHSHSIKSNFHHWRNRRFVPNSSPVRVLKDTNFLTDIGRFHLWRDLKLNSIHGFKRAASGGQETDSGSASSDSESKEVEVEPGSDGSGSNRNKEKQGKGGWRWLDSNSKTRKRKWETLLKAQQDGVWLLELWIVIFSAFSTRFIRPWNMLPGYKPRSSMESVRVPYSEFLNRINSDQILKVQVDGVHIKYNLKSDFEGGEVSSRNSRLQEESESLVTSVAPMKRIAVVYTTTRPSDTRNPYEKMLENEVEFGLLERRSGGFFTNLVRNFWLFMVCYS